MNVFSAPEVYVHLGKGKAVNSVLRGLHEFFFRSLY